MSVGGSPVQMQVSGRIFGVAADSDPTINLGGYNNEVLPNGDQATVRKKMTVVPWSIENIDLEINHVRGDLEFLQSVANNSDLVVITLVLQTATFTGLGTITGEFKAATQATTAPCNFMGAGSLEQQ